VKDPLEINPLEVVNPLEVRDPLPSQLSKVSATSTSDLLMNAKQKLDFMLFPQWHALVQFNAIHAIFVSSQINFCIQRSIVFSTNGDVELFVHRRPVDVKPFLGVASQPVPLTIASVYDFVDRIRTIVMNVREMQVCRGLPAEKYKPGWRTCPLGKIDENPFSEYSYNETFRSLKCLWLVRRAAFKCAECAKVLSPLAKYAAAATRPNDPYTASTHIYLTK